VLEQSTERAPDLQVVHDAPLPHVALVGLPPVYAHGLQIVLRASTASCTIVHDLAQLPVLLPDHRLVVVVPAGAGAVVLAAVALPTGSPAQHAVVVVVDEATPQTCAQALRAGVTGVIAASDTPDDVITVLRCAGQGRTVLSRELAQALCRPATLLPSAALSADERAWLRRLAAGGTVAGLARSCGYSEREMYRRLSAVYSTLGARTRTEALLHAERLGLFDDRA
jgi:DNA-binding NarL/FixJ family response regulator